MHESQRHHKGEKEKELRQQYPKLDGGAFFSIDCIENYELIRELSSFGKELIVLAPEKIQEVIITKITDMLNKYQMLNK
ncbi:MAG: hypothetical protein II856_00695 [Bacteroidales bacterium]|nr:hypothetical protein [Bacteroidales bacterium]